MEETVTITVDEYAELLNASNFLDLLHEEGVENWEGYDDACMMLSKLYGVNND